MSMKSALTVVLACATWLGLGEAAKCEPAAGEPTATFKKLAAYISSNPLDFTTYFSSRSAILNTDLISGKARVTAVQPNLLRLDTTGSKGSFVVISDGTTLTVLDRATNRYAQTSAPDSLSATVNLFTGLMAVEPETIVFLDAVNDVVSGQGLARVSTSNTESIGKRTCNGYRVVGSEGATWEVWLEAKDIPLPCKLVSRDGDNPDAAVQTNEFTWAVSAKPAADAFKFVPPPGSKLVDFGDLGFSD